MSRKKKPETATPGASTSTLADKVASIITSRRGGTPADIVGSCADDLLDLTAGLENNPNVNVSTTAIRQLLEIYEILRAVHDELGAQNAKERAA